MDLQLEHGDFHLSTHVTILKCSLPTSLLEEYKTKRKFIAMHMSMSCPFQPFSGVRYLLGGGNINSSELLRLCLRPAAKMYGQVCKCSLMVIPKSPSCRRRYWISGRSDAGTSHRLIEVLSPFLVLNVYFSDTHLSGCQPFFLAIYSLKSKKDIGPVCVLDC